MTEPDPKKRAFKKRGSQSGLWVPGMKPPPTGMEATRIRNRRMTTDMNRQRLNNQRTAANLQMAIPKQRVPMGSLMDKGIPFNIEDPKELAEARKLCRLFYRTHDLVPLLVDIYARFPVIGLEFECKDSLIENFYTEMFLSDLNYGEFLPDSVGREYFTVGEVTALGHFNESLGVWSSEEIIDPEMIRVTKSIFVEQERVQLLVKDLVERLRNGPQGQPDIEESPSERFERNYQYCCSPETKVLTAAMEWVPVRSLQLGDKIVGFDEFAPGGRGNSRHFRETEVTATSIISAPMFDVVTDGPVVTCTGAHMWLAKHKTRDYAWIRTDQLQFGDKIRYLGEWDYENNSDVGYVAGIFDGEGHFSNGTLAFAQRPGPVLDKAVDILTQYKFNLRITNVTGGCKLVRVLGGIPEIARAVGIFRPVRLTPKFYAWLDDKAMAGSSFRPVVVQSVTSAGMGDVVALATSTKTLMAAGMFSHNTQLVKNYPEFIKAAAQDDGLDISEALVSRIVNKAAHWDMRGTPHLMRSFRTLMMEESLNAAQDAVCDRLYAPLILATLGIENLGDGEPWIPDSSDLDNVRDDMQAALSADFKLMVHNMGLKVESVFGRESCPRFDNDYERIDAKLLQAWGIGEALIAGGSGGPYASSALNREVCEQLMFGFQNKIRRHIVKRMMVIAEAQEHFDYELKGGYRRPLYREVVHEDPETGEEYVKREPKLLIPEIHFECVAPGTDILTPSGTVPVESVRVSDEVIAWDGHGYVVDHAQHTGIEHREGLVEVTTKTGKVVRCTSDHPFWTKQGWVQAQDLTVADHIRTSAGQLDAQIDSADDTDLCRFLGLLVGDGNYSTTHIALSVSDPEVDEFSCRMAEKFGLVARKKEDKRTSKVWSRSFTRPSPWKGNALRNPLHTLLREQGMWGHNGHTKRVPPVVWQSGTKGRAAFLSGYLDADGHVCKNTGVTWSSVNRKLLEDCQILLESVGIRAQLGSYKYHHKQLNRPQQPLHVLTISHKQYLGMSNDLLSPLINRKANALEEISRPPVRNTRPSFCEVEWDAVQNISHIGDGDVVTLGIAEHHTHVTAGLVSHNTLNLRDESTERMFIMQLKQAGVPISDGTLAVNIPVQFEQELERSADETVKKIIADAQAMKKAQDICDKQELPYPPQLAQELTATLGLRQQLAQTKLLEDEATQMDQQIQGAVSGAMDTAGLDENGDPQQEGGGAGPGAGGGMGGSAGEDAEAQGDPAMQGAASGLPAGAGPGGPGPMVMGPEMPSPMELSRNRLRPEESDEMRGSMPKMGKRNRRRKGDIPVIGPSGKVRSKSKIELGPSSYGRLSNVTEEQAERAVTRRQTIASRGLSDRVEDLVHDPRFYDALNMQTYEGQIGADWPEIVNGGAPESKRILDDMLEQYTYMTGTEPNW
jgi:hypothetical protein